jgi:hypothetical protein
VNAQQGNAQQALLQSLLADRLAADPGLRQMLPLLGVAQPAAPLNGAGAAPAAAAAPADLGADRAAARQALAATEAELRRVHALLDRLARALGACASCLGTDPACRYCAGTGGPGTLRPDEELLPWLLQPLLDQLDARDEPKNADPGIGR